MTTLTPIPGRAPAAVRKSSLLGPDGSPVSYYLYPSPSTNPRAYRPRHWLSPDTKQNVSSYDRWELVNTSRQLFAQIDELWTAIDSKNNWALGDAWDAHYTGADPAWGEEMENFINVQWMPNANVRGPQYGFKTSLKLSGMAWDVDGDDAMVLTETANGFPQVAFYPGTKISSSGQGLGSSRKAESVDGGPFDGAKLFDGVIYDRNSRAIGLRIVGDDGDYSDISAFNADLAYEPTWHDQGRGIPRIAVSLLKWMNKQDIDTFIQRGIKRASAVGLLVQNAEGEAGTGNEVIEGEEVEDLGQTPIDGGSISDRKVGYEELDGGETYYLSAPDGETITGLTYKNPHPNTEGYITRVTRGAIASIGWAIELLDLTSTGRAPTRLLCDLANQSIWARQCTAYRRWRRAVGYAIAKGMKTGYLRRNSDIADAMSYEPGLPRPLSVDAGNDAQADRESLKMGMTNKAILAQKNHGMHYRGIDAQRKKEILQSIADAEEINKKHPHVTFDRALELLEQRSPNPIVQQQQQRAQTPSQNAKAQAQAESLELNVRLETEKPNSRKSVKFKRAADGSLTGAEVTEE
jgi:hypothetical protein